MPTTILSSFSTFKSNLEISGLQSQDVSNRQQAVRSVVSRGMFVENSFLTGSYARSTMIGPLSKADIDVFIVLNVNEHGAMNPTSLLNKLRQVLLSTYSRSNVSRNGQAVTIEFSDFMVDVVPAFFSGNNYYIPNSIERKWIITDPRVHECYLATQNINSGGMLVPTIKMLKAWNRVYGGTIKSFYLELLAASIFCGVRMDDFPSAIRFFFDRGREKIKYTVNDPAPCGGQVQGLFSGTVGSAVNLFERSYDIAVRAESWGVNSFYVRTAVDEWRNLFGNLFPAYG